MQARKYYYAKMDRGKRHFVLLTDSNGRPVSDLPEAIRAASKVAINPFVERPESIRDAVNEFFEEKLRKREWEATTKRGHRHIRDDLRKAEMPGAFVQAEIDEALRDTCCAIGRLIPPSASVRDLDKPS